MQQYNASILIQKRHKQDQEIKERQEKEWQEHLKRQQAENKKFDQKI
jgi:hypothetical protein|tara:strand:+ start:51 stop:191 length:141 start_codon:yes stop_codon:yes gene_type:complete